MRLLLFLLLSLLLGACYNQTQVVNLAEQGQIKDKERYEKAVQQGVAAAQYNQTN